MEWELDGKKEEEEKDNNSIELQRIDRNRPDKPLPAVPPAAAKQDVGVEPTSPPKEKGEWRRNIPRRELPRPGLRALPSELRSSKGLQGAPVDGALRRSTL
jgi:hypothetical protein